jgi:hypothetical protein
MHVFLQVVEAYELLGCGLVLLEEITSGLEQWRKAILLRNTTLPKMGLRQQRIEAFDQQLELTTVGEVDELMTYTAANRHSARLQALLVKERVCGQHSKVTDCIQAVFLFPVNTL